MLADGAAHVLAKLAEDRQLRESLEGGPTAAKAKRARASEARRMSKARRAMLAEYLGERLAR